MRAIAPSDTIAAAQRWLQAPSVLVATLPADERKAALALEA
jgi:hypothetical protein